ncbi:hypothetical protein ES705_20245 [subsurface metagenome]
MILNILYIDVYFVIALLLFVTYFITFSIFGSIGFLIFSKKRPEKGNKIAFVLISFALGVCLHMVYSFIILYFQIFNFFTIYLPFIIIDICFIIYSLKKSNIRLKGRIKAVRGKKIILLLKSNYPKFLIIAIIFVLLYIFQMFIIEHRVSYPGFDPYLWFGEIWSIHKHGSFNFEIVNVYPTGFVLFTSSIISFNDNYLIAYFFCKYLPFFLSAINLIVSYEILKFFFKKKIIIFCALLIFLSNQYYFYRFSMLLPSTLSTTLGFIFLLSLKEGSFVNMLSNEIKLRKTVLSNFKNKNIIARGIILSGITMAHPLYGLYYIIFYFLFEIFFFLIILKREKTNLKLKLINMGHFFLKIFSIFSIFLVMMLPYIIYYSLSLGYSLLERFSSYIKPLYLFDPLTGIVKIGESFFNLDEIFFNISNIGQFYSSYGTGIIFIVIGIFIPVNKILYLNKKQRYLVRFIKFTFILTFLFYLLSAIIVFLPNEIFYFFTGIDKFLDIFLIRLIELFSGYWAILFVFPFVYIIIFVKRSICKIKLNRKIANKKKITKIIENKSIRRITKAFLITSFIFLSGIYYTVNYPRTLEWSRYYFTDCQTDVVLFAGNYFNENPLDEEHIILVQNQIGQRIHILYTLIQVENLEKIYYIFDYNSTHYLNSTDYIEFKGDIEFMNVSYVLFNVKFTDEDFQTNLYYDFNILYRNEDDWIFAKLK